MPRKDYTAGKTGANHARFKEWIEGDRIPGIVGYLEGEPAAWLSIEPREAFVGLANSRIFKPIDDQPVLSISCLFVRRDFRGKGVSKKLIAAAIEYAKTTPYRIIEAYPTQTPSLPDAFAWQGIWSAFDQTGFVEVARRSEKRPMMRYYLDQKHV